MAMIKCPKCGKDISDQAASCPVCGESIRVSLSAEQSNDNGGFRNESNEVTTRVGDDMIKKDLGNSALSAPQKKNNKGLIIGIVLAVLLIGGGIGGFAYYRYYNNVVKPTRAYEEADALLSSGKYAEAQQKFAALGDFSDSKDKVFECDYASASEALTKGDYDEAKVIFDKISDYKDSSDLSKECDYQKALDYYDQKDYKNAINIFSEIFDYSDSKQYVYKMFTELAGQKYIDKYAEGIEHLNGYIQTQSSSLLNYVYESALGISSEESWSPDIYDKDLNSMKDDLRELNSIESELKAVFTQDIIKKCNDTTLSSSYDTFIKVNSGANSFLQITKAYTYLEEIANGSTYSLDSDTSKIAADIDSYTKLVNSMKEEK